MSTTASAQSVANGTALWTSQGCSGCHGTPPSLPQRNAGNAAAILNYVIANDFGTSMSQYRIAAIDGVNGAAPLNATQRADLAAYIGSVFSASHNANVNYNSSNNLISLPNIELGNATTNSLSSMATVSSPTHGALGAYVNNTGGTSPQARYTHSDTNCTADSFTYRATGNAGNTSTRTVNVTIDDPGAPTANSYTAATIAYSTSPTTLTAPTLGGPAPSTLAIVAQPAGGAGTASVSGTNLRYASPATYVASTTFTYNAIGPCVATYPGTATSATRTVTVNITTPTPTTLNPSTAVPFNAGGAAPTAINIPALIGAVTGVVTGVSITTPPTLGTANVVGTTVNYTPNALNTTNDTFAYSTTGPGAGFSGTVTITITPATPPTVANSSVTVPFNLGTNPQPPAATPVPLNITGFATAVNIVTPPTNGTLLVSGTSVSYRPNANYFGPDSFVYNAQSLFGTSPTNATVSITVTTPGLPAVANSSTNIAFNPATNPQPPAATSVPLSITGFFTAVNVITPPTNGSLVQAGTSISYRPNPNYFGPDSFVYNAQSPVGTSPTNATVSLTIALPPAPTAANRSASVAFNSAGAIDLTGSITGLFTSIAVASAPAHGTTAVNGNIVTYTPTTGYTGPDSFTYTAMGPGGTSAAATVSITVQTLAPSAGAAAMSVQLNTPTTLDLAAFITGSAISGIAVANAPAHGTATVNGTKVTYTPVNNYFGTDTFTYVAFGNDASTPQSAPGTVTVTVVGRPDPTQQQNVVDTVNAQIQSLQRFGRTQISNFSRRLESLHRGGRASGAAQSRTQTPVAAAPIFVDPFGDGAAKDGTAVARANDGFAARRQPVIEHASTARGEFVGSSPQGGRDGFAAPAPSHPSTVTGLPLPSLTQVASAAGAAGTQTDAASAPLRVNSGGLASDLVSVLTSRSLNLAQALGSGGAAQPSAPVGGIDFWIEGSLNWGNQGAAASGGKIEFRTSGISFGVDRRLTDQLVMGVGMGFARDRTDIGTDGSKTTAQGASVAVYGSYQPTPNTFVDALLGAGTIDFDNERFVAPINAVAKSDRDGTQIFASIAAGYEFKRGGMLLSPYGRLDLSYDRLKDGTETGVGNFALHYFDERVRSAQGALGLRLESVHETSFGWMAPRARIELRHAFDDGHVSQIAYADLIGGQRYSISTAAVERDAIVVGIGGDFHLRGGLALGVDYQLQKNFSEGSSQGIRLRLTQALDGKSARRPAVVRAIEAGGAPHHDSSDIRVDTGVTYDDNVTRGRISFEKLHDTVVNFAVNKVELFPVSDNARVMVVGSVGGDKFDSYNGLDRLFASVRGELQYRPSADFDSPILALFGRFAGEQFESQIRRGYRASAGVSVRYPLTDRVMLFGSAAHNERFAKSSVFDTRDNALQLNVDYALSKESTVYLAGEYRRGDFVSSGTGSLANIDVARVFVADDAFRAQQLFAYRTDASGTIVTLGYNLSFGTRDSVDISWRRGRATPDSRPSFNAPGPWHYVVDQFSVVYLVRF